MGREGKRRRDEENRREERERGRRVGERRGVN